MKKLFIVIAFYLQVTSVLGQNKVDSLEFWNFHLDVYQAPDSTKSIGRISFWRTKPINDGISVKLYGKTWTPDISFDIFALSSAAYCLRESGKVKIASSCVGSDVGGDLFRIGNYLFLNRDVCVSCVKYNTGVDYCRPVLRRIVARVDKNDAKTLDAIGAQFGIKESSRPTDGK